MANVIIGIHGLDNKPSKKMLKFWWKEAMIEGLKTHKYKAKLPKFEMVYWADIIHPKALDEKVTDKNSPLYLEEKYTNAPKISREENHETRKKIIDFLEKQIKRIFLNDDLSLNYSHITDVFVERYFQDLDIYFSKDCENDETDKCKAKTAINKRLTDVLMKHKSDDILLISHSMGTIISFEVLSKFAYHIPIKTFITIGSPLGLPQVLSKVSETLSSDQKANKSIKTPPSLTENWYNFSDILDTVAFDYKLADDFSENSHGVSPKDFLVVNNYEINGKRNHHKSYGYLRTPEFSKVLNDFIQSEKLNLLQKTIRRCTHFFHTLRRLKK